MSLYKALSIHQPYADLIVRGEKFVENRTWATPWRGLLLIHASKGSRYLSPEKLAEYPTGCLVGAADLVAVVRLPLVDDGQLTPGQAEVVRQHEHAEGPFGWVLANVRRFDWPLAWRGAQGVFEVRCRDGAVGRAIDGARPVVTGLDFVSGFSLAQIEQLHRDVEDELARRANDAVGGT